MSPVNVERLTEASLGDPEFLRELVELFLGDTPQQLQALQQAIEAADANGVHRGAHRLKCAGTNLGALTFGEICLKLEQMGKQQDLTKAPDLFRDLREEYDRVQVLLSGLAKAAR